MARALERAAEKQRAVLNDVLTFRVQLNEYSRRLRLANVGNT